MRDIIPVHISKQLKKNLWAKGRSTINNMIYLMLVLPLRAKQVQMLDNGSLDEYVYLNRSMVKNKKGIKGRKEGFLQMGYYKGENKVQHEYLYVNTNKGNLKGFNIYWIKKEIVEIIKYQLNVGSGNLLFNENGEVIKKSLMYKAWFQICKEVEKISGFKLIDGSRCLFDLHSLRVSGISNALKNGMDLKVLSHDLVGHHGTRMTLHYASFQDIKNMLKNKIKEIGYEKEKK